MTRSSGRRPSGRRGGRQVVASALALVGGVGMLAGGVPSASAAPTPGLSLTATASPVAVSRVGQTVDHSVVVINRGTSAVTNLLVSDPAAGMSAPVCSPVPQGGTLPGGARTTCRSARTTTLTELAGTEVADTFRASAQPAGGGALVRAAVAVSVAVTAAGPRTSDDSASTVAAGPSVVLPAAADDSPGESGGPAIDPGRTVLVGGTAEPAYGDKAVTTDEGRWAVQANGSVRFEPAALTRETTATLAYRAYDLAGRSALGRLSVRVFPGPVYGGPTVVSTRQGQPADADVLATADPGVDGSGARSAFDPKTLRLTSVWPRAGYAITYLPTRQRISIGDVGDFLVTDGRIRFTPVPGFRTTTPTITWTAQTLAGTQAVGRLSAAVQETTGGSVPARTAPVAVGDRAITTSQVRVSLGGQLNDLPGPDPLDGTTIAFPHDQLAGLPTGSTISVVDGEEQLAVAGQGTYRTYRSTDYGNVWFTPDATFVGEATPVDYTIADTAGRTSRAALTVSVLRGAIARPDAVTTRQGRSVTANVLFDDDAGGAPQIGTNPRWLDPRLTTTGLPAGSTLDADGTRLSVPGQGDYTVNPTRTVTFVPRPGFRGTATPVTVALQASVPVAYADPAVVDLTSTLTVTVLASEPVAKPDTRTTAARQPLVVPVLANDAPGSPVVPLVGASLRLRLVPGLPTGSTLSADAKTLVVAGRGTFSAAGNGDVLFVPLGAAAGAVPAVGYQVADTNGTTARSTLQVSVG